MNRLSRGLLGLVFLGGASMAQPTWADTLFSLRVLREDGCGGALPSQPPLHHDALLDRTAAEWAAGRALSAAAELSGYQAVSTAGVHVAGPDEAMLALLRRSGCETVASPGFRDVGYYRRGMDTWVVLASGAEPKAVPLVSKDEPQPVLAKILGDPGQRISLARVWTPSQAPTPILATRALELVNDVRAHGTHCGEQLFGPAPPLTLSGTLASVAFGHASDMALHNYFEHQDPAGQSPADRVRAVGYQEKLVGENIAYGPETVEEVVKGWLDSPGHCANMMDPRFVEMGIASASGQVGRHGLYWVQVFAEPRA